MKKSKHKKIARHSSRDYDERLYSVVTFYRKKKTAYNRLAIKQSLIKYASLPGTKINFSRIEKKNVIIYSYKIYTPFREAKFQDDLRAIYDRVIGRARRNKAESITTSLQKYQGKVLDYYKGIIAGDRTKAAKQFAVHIKDVRGSDKYKGLRTLAYNMMIRPGTKNKDGEAIDGMWDTFKKHRMIGYTISELKSNERKRRVHK